MPWPRPHPFRWEKFIPGVGLAVVDPLAKFNELTHPFQKYWRSLKFADGQIPDTGTIPCTVTNIKKLLATPISWNAKNGDAVGELMGMWVWAMHNSYARVSISQIVWELSTKPLICASYDTNDNKDAQDNKAFDNINVQRIRKWKQILCASLELSHA